MICMGNVWLAARAALTIPYNPSKSHDFGWSAGHELVMERLHESVRRFETESPLKYDEGPFTWIQMGSNEPPDS